MIKNEQYLEDLLKSYEIDTTRDDLLLHGFHEPTDSTVEEKIQSIFENGLKKTNSSLSILSTTALCRTEKPIGQQISNYVSRGRFRVIIHIPKQLENIFFGNCIKAHGDAGNQYGNKCLLDFLELESIPSEFIVGVYSTDSLMYDENEEVKYSFVENKNYFNHKTNKVENTKKLLEKIKSKLNNNSTMSMIKNAMDLDQKFDSKKWLAFCESIKLFSRKDDFSPFAYQRIDHDILTTSTFNI